MHHQIVKKIKNGGGEMKDKRELLMESLKIQLILAEIDKNKIEKLIRSLKKQIKKVEGEK